MKRKYGFALLWVILGLLTYHALTAGFFPWDLAITKWVQGIDAEKIVGPIAGYNNRLGIAGVAGVIGVLLMGWLWLKGWRAEAFFVGLVGIADLLNPLLRELIGSPRPFENIVLVYRPESDSSFPSGTSMHVIMFCGIIIYLLRHLPRPGLLRTTLWVLLGLYIPIMGVWLIYRGCHWPSDVLGGYVYGAIFLWAIIWGYQKYTSWRRRYPKDHLPKENLPPFARPFTWILTLVN